MFDALLSAYGLYAITPPEPIGSGLINKTFLVNAREGKFVIQNLHAVIPEAAVEDMRAVTTFLATKEFLVPYLRPCTNGAWIYRDANGGHWRVYPYLRGHVVESMMDAGMAREAGLLIGRMHADLKHFAYVPQGSIPHFHDTAFILNELRSVQEQLPEEVKKQAEMIAQELPPLIERIALEPKQLIHGDLKISNILFDQTGHAIGLIDFDTILHHAALIDIGDAYRSWCNKTSEDDPHATFNLPLFDAAFAGYQEGAAGHGDRDLHLAAAKVITLELASRFLIDVVRDTYFGFDPKKYKTRKEANIARAIAQVHLAETIPI